MTRIRSYKLVAPGFKTSCKFTALVFFLALLFAVSGVFAKTTLAAPRLYLDPVQITSDKDAQFEVKVQIDVESQSAFGADGFVKFIPTDVRLDTVTKGEFFGDFAYSASTGQTELHGYFGSTFDSNTGSGTLATLKFTLLKDSGSSDITFTCTGSGNDTQILNTNGVNILACGSLNQSTITTTSSSVAPPPPPPPPPPSSSNGNSNSGNQATKACAGSCSTGNDCDAGLFCYQGVCRNPACKSDTDCKCSVATPRPSTKPKPKATIAPAVVALVPYVSPTPEPSITPIPVSENVKDAAKPVGVEIIALIIVLTALIVGAFILFKMLKNKNKPPYVNLSQNPEQEPQNQNPPNQNPPQV